MDTPSFSQVTLANPRYSGDFVIFFSFVHLINWTSKSPLKSAFLPAVGVQTSPVLLLGLADWFGYHFTPTNRQVMGSMVCTCFQIFHPASGILIDNLDWRIFLNYIEDRWTTTGVQFHYGFLMHRSMWLFCSQIMLDAHFSLNGFFQPSHRSSPSWFFSLCYVSLIYGS